jgi:cysteine synthase
MADTALRTPLFSPFDDVFLKCEFLHPGRSHKARVARALVDDAESRGAISSANRPVLLERTGGNLGIALAIEARTRGYELTLVTDPHYSRIKREIATRFGATVINRGIDYPECRNNQEVIDILLESTPTKYLYLNQFANPANPRAHEQGTGAEILTQLIGRDCRRDSTAVLLGGLGTGASMRGVSSALRSWFDHVVTIGVQPPNCDLLANEYGDHHLEGIAVGQAPPFFDIRQLDGIVPVTQEQVLNSARDLEKRYRFTVGPSSAANFAAVPSALEHPAAGASGHRVLITILYDRGEDYEWPPPQGAGPAENG